ncbi:MAG: hypothetical protein CMM33_04030 [Rhodospirillaceae bacterium]|jgi:AcrR family transcriptional regulator|nr:hypothetical protein [Rhodospirillaceae bacterium]|tara:strand:- start:21 stop:632 length:612 start_codon:yes stop_codon:yes gene_type:complete
MSEKQRNKAESPNRKIILIDTTLSLAGELGWPSVTLQLIGKTANVPLSEVSAIFSSKWDILEAFRERTDLLLTAGKSANLSGQSAKDRLFDILMARIEIIEPWKAGIGSIARHAVAQPITGIRLFTSLNKSMECMIEHVNAKIQGPGKLIQSRGLTLIYLLVLRRWIGDHSSDLGPTMAELNERLISADQLISRICGWRKYQA